MKRNYLFPVLLLLQIILVKTIGSFPNFVEEWYSKGLYPKIAWFFRTSLGSLPFSVGDIIYIVLLVLIFRWIWKNKSGFFKNWKVNGLSILKVITIGYFFFHLLWGMNYYRVPLHEKLQIEKEYTEIALEELIEKLIVTTNELQFSITKNDTVAVKIPYSDDEIYELAIKGYQKLPNDLQDFNYEVRSIKTSLWSYPLSYMGFGGYLNPFTNEAQINSLKPKYTSPMTTCHEMAHQTGIGSESECNFIGFIAAAQNEDVYFQYSAYSFALRYALNRKEKLVEGSASPYKQKINQGVLKNFDEHEKFWETYHTPINTVFEVFYDQFLKSNQQKDGMEGYGKFIGLLIGYEKISNF